MQNAQREPGADHDIEASGTCAAGAVSEHAGARRTGTAVPRRGAARGHGASWAAARPTRAPIDYRVTANLEARNVAFRQGTTHIAGVGLDSAVTRGSRRASISADCVWARFGGTLTGAASLENLDRFQCQRATCTTSISSSWRAHSGQAAGLRRRDLGAGAGGGQHQESGGGGGARGPRHRAGTARRAGLGQAECGLQRPRRHGDAGEVLPRAAAHARSISPGSLGQRIEVRAVSRDLADFRPVAGDLPVKFNAGGVGDGDRHRHGQAERAADRGRCAGDQFQRRGPAVHAAGGELRGLEDRRRRDQRRAGARSAAGELRRRRWGCATGSRRTPRRCAPTSRVRNADVQDVLALAGQTASVPVTGALTVDAHVNGTVGDPQGSADISRGQRHDRRRALRFADRARGHDAGRDRRAVAGAWSRGLRASTPMPATGTRPNDLQHGNFRAHVASNQVQLAQFQSLVKDRPGLARHAHAECGRHRAGGRRYSS